MAASRYGVVLTGAVVIGLAATYLVYRTVEATKASARIVTVPVVVAARDVGEGQIIDRAAVVIAQWPQPTVPAGAFGSIDSVAGRVARVNVFSGEPIVPGRLAPVGTGPGLEVKIASGKRAIGLRVNDVTSISGMIQPNSRVDILLILNNDGDRQARTFMSNMRVLAMGTTIDRGADGRAIQTSVATIEVTPEESEMLAVAQTQGQVQLSLRGYGDPDTVQTRGATMRDVEAQLRVGTVAPPPPVRRPQRPSPASAPAPTPAPVAAPAPSAVTRPAPPVRPDSHSVRVIRGRTSEDKKFAKDTIKRDTLPF